MKKLRLAFCVLCACIMTSCFLGEKYALSYDDNGSTGGSVPASEESRAGKKLTVSDNSGSLVKTGTFYVAWNTAADGKGTSYAPGSSLVMPDNDLTLYAQWFDGVCAVTFDPNGGTGIMASQDIGVDGPHALSANAYARTNYSFQGWSTSPTGSVEYADAADLVIVQPRITLYAIWALSRCTATFDPNGGTGTMANQDIDVDGPHALRANAYDRTNYSFRGWSTSPTGTVEYADGAALPVAQPQITLYAAWALSRCTVTFDSNGGTGSMSNRDIEVGGSHALPAGGFTAPTGFDFYGWSVNTSGIVDYPMQPSADLAPAAPFLTLYARWIKTGALAQKADFAFTIANDAATISGYTGTAADMVIPDFSGQYPVTAIGNNIFEDRTFSSAYLPATIESIGIRAFFRCRSLRALRLPARLGAAGSGAFCELENLAAFTVDAANASFSVMDGVLFDYGKTVLVSYPKGKGGSVYTVPSTVARIAGQAFQYCESLNTVVLPAGLTKIDDWAFYFCSGLNSIHSGTLEVGSLNLPVSLQAIGNYAFQDCVYGYSQVRIPASVASIGNSAFDGSENLANVHMTSGTPPALGYTAFNNVDPDLVIHVPSGAVETYRAAPYWSTYGSRIQSP